MTCPSCGRRDLNEFADKCDTCGYAFRGPQMDPLPVLASINRSLRTIKSILVWWLALSIIAAAVYVISRL
jgi:ribosomal protein L37AE/L43A